MEISSQYLSGLFDGEGSVSITNRLMARASITQKRNEILFKLKEIYGGIVSVGICSHWIISKSEDLIIFLEDIYPYSIIKKNEIELCLEVARMMKSNNKGYNPMTSEEINNRINLRNRLQQLRPNSNFKTGLSSSIILRDKIIKEHNGQCCICDVIVKNKLDTIIKKDEKLYCRSCHISLSRPGDKNLKVVTKEQIEEAIKNTKSVELAAKSLGISRCILYEKRKKFGLQMSELYKHNLTR